MKVLEYCQPRGVKSASCSACCGLYNWVGYNRELVSEVVELQTELYLNSGQTMAELKRIRQELASRRPLPLYPRIYNCEFIGFIDREKKRVGCLLHPLINQGRNLREASRHRRETCDEMTCTAGIYLKPEEAQLIAQAVDDWYLYGLCLTDLDLIREFFRLASQLVGEEVRPEQIRADFSLLEIFSRYLGLKERWEGKKNPYRFGKYYFSGRDYLVYKPDYSALGVAPSKYDKILVSLGLDFENRALVCSVREEIASLFKDFVQKWH